MSSYGAGVNFGKIWPVMMLLVEYCEFVDCAHFCRNTELLLNSYINPLNTKSDQHLISPYSNTAESFIKLMRMKEMIANLRITH